MRICIISEGCYPYVVGGVSGWVHSMIQTFPKQEFILLSIIADRELSGKFQTLLDFNRILRKKTSKIFFCGI